MKKYFKYSLILFLSFYLITITGCEDYLDIAPEMEVDPEDVFSNFHSFRQVSDLLYVMRTNPRDWQPREWPGVYSDEMVSGSWWNAPGYQVKKGDNWLNMTNSSNPELGTKTRKTYGGVDTPPLANARLAIRHANLCFSNFHLLTDATEKEKNEIKGELFYFRAYAYFQMIKRWGGMPDLTKLFAPGDNFDLERLSYQESTDLLVADLDSAIRLLPKKSERQSKDLGRVTKGWAMALKEMALLYAASPLMNLNYEYNMDYCKRGIQAAIKMLELAELEGEYRLLPWNEYSDNYYSKTIVISDEAIVYDIGQYNTWGRNGKTTAIGSHRWGNMNIFASPTQNAVDMFGMANGYPIDHPNSGYNPNDPYSGRDPRFYQSIMVCGDYVSNFKNKNHPEWDYYEPFSGGIDDATAGMKVQNYYVPKSGYMMKKFWPHRVCNTKVRQWDFYVPWIEIRLSQIYLDFAEMANEVYGPTTKVPGTENLNGGAGYSALDAINKIRAKVGSIDIEVRDWDAPTVTSKIKHEGTGYAGPGTPSLAPVPAEFYASKEVFRDRIRNEREVELMFEGAHRWFDIRRWHIAVDVFRDGLYQAYIIKNPDNSFEYGTRLMDDLYQNVFRERNYWYPLPPGDTYIGPNFKQNPGW